MIEQYLSNKNKSATVSKIKKFSELNKALVNNQSKRFSKIPAETCKGMMMMIRDEVNLSRSRPHLPNSEDKFVQFDTLTNERFCCSGRAGPIDDRGSSSTDSVVASSL